MGRQINLNNLRSVQLLQECYWPGNVRELENFCERFIALALTDEQIDQDELLKLLLQESRQDFKSGHNLDLLEEGNWKANWHKVEKNLLEQMLAESGITKTALAKSLGISRVALWKKMKEKPNPKE
jgi:transcriptional regulator with PAS, ATPase and Fis domain